MKKALIIITIFIGVILIVAALLPSTSYVERDIIIQAPKDLVFDQVNDLKKNFNWSPWIDYDPDMKVEWGEITSGQGASYSWSGNKDVGSGILTIAESVENQSIKNEIDFGSMGKGTGTWNFTDLFVEDDNGDLMPKGVVVTWGMESKLDWPIGRFFGLFMDGMVGPDFEKGLQKLKDVSESLPVVPKIMVEEVDMPSVTLLSLKDSVLIDEIEMKMGEMYGKLMAVLEEKKIEMTGAPVCVFHVWNEEEGYTVLEAGLPVSETTAVKAKNGIGLIILPERKAAKAVHMGSYNNLNNTHFAIDEWILKNGKEIGGAPMEVYLTDPQAQPDTALWMTEVYYPIL